MLRHHLLLRVFAVVLGLFLAPLAHAEAAAVKKTPTKFMRIEK